MPSLTNVLFSDDLEHVLVGRWKFGEDFIRDKVKENTRYIQYLKAKVIDFGNFEEGEIHAITVDGVNYCTHEFRLTPSTKFYNHKKNGCGLKYEYGVAIRRVSNKKYIRHM